MFLDERSGSLSILRSYLSGRTGGSYNFSQPKIENLRVSALGDEDVRGLDVAMDNASP